MAYKIEMSYLGGWDDAGWTECIEAAEWPMRFETIADAQTVLAEFYADVKEAVAKGNLDRKENRNDYRIAVVS